MNTSSAVSSPASTASSWKANHRLWSCMTHLGSPVVPDVELRRNTSSAPSHRSSGRSLSAARPSTCGDEVAGAGPGHEVVDLAGTGAPADADHDEPGLLARDERGVHSGPVGHLHGDPVPGPEAFGDEMARQLVGPAVVVVPGQTFALARERQPVGFAAAWRRPVPRWSCRFELGRSLTLATHSGFADPVHAPGAAPPGGFAATRRRPGRPAPRGAPGGGTAATRSPT